MIDYSSPATYAGDIHLSLARAAHGGTSFVPETRAAQELASYASTLVVDFNSLAAGLGAADDPRRATLAVEFERYRQGYRKRYAAELASKSRIVSTMIAGPSNFPARRMEKRNRIADKRYEELAEYRTRALAAIRKTLHPELAPIMAGDADAVERLQAKLSAAKVRQEVMKACNAAIRKHAKAGPGAQIAALVALGVAESIARELLKPDEIGRVGHASYELTNNGAEIRRLEGRLVQLERAKATALTLIEGLTGVRLEDVPAENRVRLFFPGKPSEEIRTRLKQNGFRWTPSLGCWQAYRNDRAISAARREAGAP